MDTTKTGIIIVAAGGGKRMGGSIPKQFALVDREPILVRTINNFAKSFAGAKIVVVLSADKVDFWHNLAARFRVARHSVVVGGKERFHSVKCGIEALSDAVDLIAVQDGVRPFASPKMLQRTAEEAAKYGSAIPVVTPVDSFREVCGDDGSTIIDRYALRIVQTPQIFRADILRAAYDTDFLPSFTDDASVVEHAGYKIHLCEGERNNIKITTPEDMIIAEAITDAQRQQ